MDVSRGERMTEKAMSENYYSETTLWGLIILEVMLVIVIFLKLLGVLK